VLGQALLLRNSSPKMGQNCAMALSGSGLVLGYKTNLMKTIFSYTTLLLLVLTSSFTIDTQQKLNAGTQVSESFSYFRAHRQGKGVSLAWSLPSTQITEFVVERSYDGDYYEPLAFVPSTGTACRYSDTDVFPGIIYYRVVAVHASGGTTVSAVERVRIVQRG
jgi:hypothetical protein